jgi:hypothetical protein
MPIKHQVTRSEVERDSNTFASRERPDAELIVAAFIFEIVHLLLYTRVHVSTHTREKANPYICRSVYLQACVYENDAAVVVGFGEHVHPWKGLQESLGQGGVRETYVSTRSHQNQ